MSISSDTGSRADPSPIAARLKKRSIFTRRESFFLLFVVCLTITSIVVSCFAGHSPLSIGNVYRTLAAGDSSLDAAIFVSLRLPRVLGAFVAGGLLALSGALMQVLLRNPLADPYILGISGGASVGALGAILLGVGGYFVSAGAFVGALSSMIIVFWVANGVYSNSTLRLLLSGVVIASGWGALVSFLLTVAPETRLRGMMFWLMGDLSQTGPMTWWAPTLLLTGGCGAFALSSSLNVLSRGDLQAKSVGASVGTLRLAIYLSSSLFAGGAVTIAGSVGFIGLIIPHMVRLLAGSDHRIVIPACVLLGGLLLVAADFLARELMWPQQLPVGIVTAILGVPVFLFLLRRSA